MKFQPSVVCSFGIIATDSGKSKVINLYSDYTENKLQALTFAAITSVWISLQRCNWLKTFTMDQYISHGIVLAL